MAEPQSDDPLLKEDWRYHAIERLNSGTQAIATTERLAQSVVSFGLPSAPALFLNLARQAHVRRMNIDVYAEFMDHPADQGKWPEDHARLFDYFECFAAEIIFSFIAIEVFVNESIPSSYIFRWRKNKKSETLQGAEIERRLPLDEKLKRVLPEAHNLPSPAGTEIWEEYLALKLIRDRLVHLKSIDRKSSGSENQTIWGLMLEKKEQNFPEIARKLIGSFEELTNKRRWFRLASAGSNENK